MIRGICLLLLAACGDLATVPVGTCGNLVIEGDEQCDGSEHCNDACRFVCKVGETACPDGLACSADGACAAPSNRFVAFALAPRYELPAQHLIVGDLDSDGRDDLIGLGDSIRVRFGAPTEPLLASYEKQIRPATGAPAFGELDGNPGLDIVFPTADGVFTLVARDRELVSVPYASATALPDDSAHACTPSPGWAACRSADLDRDGRPDRIGFIADRDNLVVQLARATGPAIEVTIDTVDIVTALTSGDFDGDGFDDVAYATRSANGVAGEAVYVLYGAPQAAQFTTSRVASADRITGIAAAELSSPPDGLTDLAVARTGAANGVSVYLGNASRDLSAPFALDGGRGTLDIPYAVVAGEFVGGAGSGADVMAYARNPMDPDHAYYWWLRGTGAAQLQLDVVDQVATAQAGLLTTGWVVGDLVTDLSTQLNGPDEVIGLAPSLAGCVGPALSAAIPSARGTATDLIRSACLAVPGTGWAAEGSGLLYRTDDHLVPDRAVVIAHRGDAWWLGSAARLDSATQTHELPGSVATIGRDCRDAQLWTQLAEVGTFVSVACDDGATTKLIGIQQRPGEDPQVVELAEVPLGAAHLAGDFNGDGLTDLVVRDGDSVEVLLQCTADLPGC